MPPPFPFNGNKCEKITNELAIVGNKDNILE